MLAFNPISVKRNFLYQHYSPADRAYASCTLHSTNATLECPECVREFDVRVHGAVPVYTGPCHNPACGAMGTTTV